MRNAIYGSILFSLLSACSSMPVSEQIAEQAKSDLRAVERVLMSSSMSIPNECRNALENDLNTVFVQIKNIDSKISSSVDACRVEKDVLESKVTNRNLVICFLSLAIAGLVFIKIKT